MEKPREKYTRLEEILGNLEDLAVAFSGGVDSAFLLKAAKDVLGSKAVAITVNSPVFPEWEFEASRKIARDIGVEQVVVRIELMNNRNFTSNPPDRCYFCKKAVFNEVKRAAYQLNLHNIADGTNYDDIKDFRPGARAVEELGVICPLKDAGLTKEDIRKLSREKGLPTWNRPTSTCFATRFPYGEEITMDKLERVKEAERFLHGLGYKQLRVRSHGEIARIELGKDEKARLLDLQVAHDVDEKLRSLGFKYVTLDLRGYRSGSMNEVLEGFTGGQKVYREDSDRI